MHYLILIILKKWTWNWEIVTILYTQSAEDIFTSGMWTISASAIIVSNDNCFGPDDLLIGCVVSVIDTEKHNNQ